ncbi:MAG: hypothetical protein LN416_01395 [Candidatus Thermoplasmatota archaeon]|nr:hypothetical protein [Candidatus Thermoplasmatota archaeon]
MRFEDHQRKAKRNLDFYNGYTKGQRGHKDWMITVLLYLAVHYIDEYLSRVHGIDEMKHRKASPHSVRSRYVTDRLPHLQRKFRSLLQHSFDARYRDKIEKSMNLKEVEGWEKWVLTECKGLLQKTT